MIKDKIKSGLIWIIPYYKKLKQLREESEKSLTKNIEILGKIDKLISDQERIKLSISQISKKIRMAEAGVNDGNHNVYNEIVLIPKKKSNVTEYNCSLDDFLAQVKHFIIETNIVVDIGCGIRPQQFFTPKFHICIEPFKQYREIIKPFFPNSSSFLFIKEDGLKGIKIFDDNSVDTVFMLDLIEHLEKNEGIKLISEANRIARRQVIIFTPLGFYPMSFKRKGEKDAWGLDGNQLQEHKSGWLPKDFNQSWQLYICKDCHEAFLPKERKSGKKYSALLAIMTKEFKGFQQKNDTPSFVIENYQKKDELT